MLVRITRTYQNEMTVLRVEGGLSSEIVDQLAQECDMLDNAFVLDVANLRSIDAAGSALLAELASRGVAMRGISPYIALRMQQHASPPAAQTHQWPETAGAWHDGFAIGPPSIGAN